MKDPLREAAQAFVNKIDECVPYIADLCFAEQNRGRFYKGPSFADELEALRTALATPAADSGSAQVLAWFVNSNQGAGHMASVVNWFQVRPGDPMWSDNWKRYPLVASLLTRDAGEPVAHTTERHIALREGHSIAAEDAYFAPRPVEDGAMQRRAFQQGFQRGFDAGEKVYATPPQGADALDALMNAVRANGSQMTNAEIRAALASQEKDR